jgi:hypothetical protein
LNAYHQASTAINSNKSTAKSPQAAKACGLCSETAAYLPAVSVV